VIEPIDTVTFDVDQTRRLGARLARSLRPGVVVALFGDLGAGKTVFAQGLAEGLGVDEPVSSPTFNLVQQYRAPPLDGWFFHLDMYRIGDAQEAIAFGVEDYLFAPDGVTAVEWADRIAELLVDAGLHDREAGGPRLVSVRIEHAGEGRRRIRIQPGMAE